MPSSASPVVVAATALVLFACEQPGRETGAAADTPTSVDVGDLAQIAVSRPTVAAYFIVPDGAVDTMPDLAVKADDWNYAMATVGDSLEANGVGFALIIEPRLRLTSSHGLDTTLTLGEPLTAGYVFVRPDEAPCVRRRPLDPDSVLTVARRVFAVSTMTRELCE
ncbi:MAG TPA: hypothetical protein VFZ21_03400 [Gemmatimonadaceae bacterium]|nr:hypothetical protein [Gemmatimonadaceae bacterium]